MVTLRRLYNFIPIDACRSQNKSDNFGNISLTKALLGKYLKEKC